MTARLLGILLVLAAVGGIGWGINHWDNGRLETARQAGRTEIQAKWDKDSAARAAATLAEEKSHARETLRRLEVQQRNQDAQNQELARARADAERNRADADGLREQNAAAARRWSDTLSNAPSVAECAAAGPAIVVQADVLGRSDRAASELASYSDAARAAGLKCERDYDALTPPDAASTKGASDGR
jgi:hypothetical protein